MTTNDTHGTDPGPSPENDSGGRAWIQPRRIYRVTAVRTGITSDLQLLAGTGPFELNMLVREVGDPRQLELSGRVIQAGPGAEPVRGLPVAVVDGAGHPLGDAASSDEFGEFRLRAETGRRCALRLGEGPTAPCVSIYEDE